MLPLGFVAVLGLAAAASLLAVVWLLLPYDGRRRCDACGASRAGAGEACDVCGAPAGSVPAHPGAAPYGFPRPGRRPAGEPEVHGGVAYNRAVPRRIATVATAAMLAGIAVRLVGMAGILGLPALPMLVDGLLTVAGGIVAFVGFVLLDAA